MLVYASKDHRAHNPTELHLFAGEALPPREIPARAEVILDALKAAGLVEVREPDPLDSDPSALEGEDYLRLGERLARLGRPMVLVQEGGYDLRALGKNVAAVLEGFIQAR